MVQQVLLYPRILLFALIRSLLMEQKIRSRNILPDLCSGKKLGAFGLTEPGAGTDAQGVQTKAVSG